MSCDFRITTIVGKHNIEHIPSLVTFVEKEFGVQHRFDVIQSVGRGKECKELIVSSEDFASLMREIQKEVKFLDDRDRSEDRDWSIPACGAGSEMLFVDAYGNAGICPTLTRDQDPSFFAGNILTESVKSVWENSRTFSLFRGIQCEKIADCSAREKCSGGCRSRAFLSSANLRAPDTLLCKLFN